MAKACASIDESTIIVTPCDDDAASGYRLNSVDDLGNAQYYFLSGDRVWYVGCPMEASGDLTGLPIEISRPYWASIILEAATAFLT